MEYPFGGCRASIPSVIAVLFVITSLLPIPVAATDDLQENLEYVAIKQRLARGWNTWNTRSVLSHTLLPEGGGLNLAFKQVKWLDIQWQQLWAFVESGEMPAPEKSLVDHSEEVGNK